MINESIKNAVLPTVTRKKIELYYNMILKFKVGNCGFRWFLKQKKKILNYKEV